MARPNLAQFKRIVVKIGSALLVDEQSHTIRIDWLKKLAEDIAELRQQGKEVIIVSSGAIAIGREHLGLTGPKLKLEEKQAAAATGMARLTHAYQEALEKFDITVSTVLVTPEDTEARRRHLNARNTINTLLRLGAIPIINENDTIATAEIRFGDNDRLAARVAQMVSADALILLSDVDGLFTADPRKNPDAKLLPVIEKIDDQIENMAGKPLPGYSSGGMVTKIAAARIAVGAGCSMAIVRGNLDHPLHRLAVEADGEEGQAQFASWFTPAATPRTARKKWIAAHVEAAGAILIDDGAENALLNGKSLLAAGIKKIEGPFERGDLIRVLNLQNQEIARGLTAYSADDVFCILGRQSNEIAKILGYSGRDEVIHRDDLVLS